MLSPSWFRGAIFLPIHKPIISPNIPINSLTYKVITSRSKAPIWSKYSVTGHVYTVYGMSVERGISWQ
jgi:hypothetical protein